MPNINAISNFIICFVGKKKKYPKTIHLEITPTSRSKRTEGLDILARIIARYIAAGQLLPPGEDNSQGKDKKIES
jgi:hypothetical protein